MALANKDVETSSGRSVQQRYRVAARCVFASQIRRCEATFGRLPDFECEE